MKNQDRTGSATVQKGINKVL